MPFLIVSMLSISLIFSEKLSPKPPRTTKNKIAAPVVAETTDKTVPKFGPNKKPPDTVRKVAKGTENVTTAT